jgi:uncharacterized protein YjaZ
VGYGRTLEEAVVTEGLAQHMEAEMGWGAGPPAALGPGGRELVAARFEAERRRADVSFSDWFFGGGGGLPPGAGYLLGYRVVADHLAQTGERASNLAGVQASAVLERTVDRRGLRPYLGGHASPG